MTTLSFRMARSKLIKFLDAVSKKVNFVHPQPTGLIEPIHGQYLTSYRVTFKPKINQSRVCHCYVCVKDVVYQQQIGKGICAKLKISSDFNSLHYFTRKLI